MFLNLSSMLPQIFGDWRWGSQSPNLQSPKIWGSIEERLRHIEGFLPLNFTSSLKSCQTEVLYRSAKILNDVTPFSLNPKPFVFISRLLGARRLPQIPDTIRFYRTLLRLLGNARTAGFLPTPPGRSWFPSNSSRQELVSLQLLPTGVGFLPTTLVRMYMIEEFFQRGTHYIICYAVML